MEKINENEKLISKNLKGEKMLNILKLLNI